MEGALECGLGVEPELDNVAEANIDDDAHACSGDFSIGLHAEPAMFEFPADQVHGEARCVERHAVRCDWTLYELSLLVLSMVTITLLLQLDEDI